MKCTLICFATVALVVAAAVANGELNFTASWSADSVWFQEDTSSPNPAILGTIRATLSMNPASTLCRFKNNRQGDWGWLKVQWQDGITYDRVESGATLPTVAASSCSFAAWTPLGNRTSATITPPQQGTIVTIALNGEGESIGGAFTTDPPLWQCVLQSMHNSSVVYRSYWRWNSANYKVTECMLQPPLPDLQLQLVAINMGFSQNGSDSVTTTLVGPGAKLLLNSTFYQLQPSSGSQVQVTSNLVASGTFSRPDSYFFRITNKNSTDTSLYYDTEYISNEDSRMSTILSKDVQTRLGLVKNNVIGVVLMRLIAGDSIEKAQPVPFWGNSQSPLFEYIWYAPPGPTPKPGDIDGDDTAAIIGGVVGGVALLGIVAFFVHRRRANAYSTTSTSTDPANTTGTYQQI